MTWLAGSRAAWPRRLTFRARRAGSTSEASNMNTPRIERHTYGQGTRDDEIADLVRAVFIGEGHSSPEGHPLFAPEVLATRGLTWIALDGARVAGTVLLVGADNRFRQIAVHPEAEVHLLAVAPWARGRGLGRALLEALTEHARGEGVPKLVLSTQPSMTAAHALYTAAGYSRAPGRDWQRSDRSFWAFEKMLSLPG